MPKQCPHFKLLEDRVLVLKSKFLDAELKKEEKDPLTFDADNDQLAAFRLLFHGEVEDFLESKAKENIKKLEQDLKHPRWVRSYPELLSLAMALKKQAPISDDFDLQKFKSFVDVLIAGANSSIKENNGIKSQSFLLLSICAGKTIDEIDTVLSSSLNSYGKDRGDVAHKSVTHSRTLSAPSTELANASTLVTQIGAYFDVTA